MSTIVLRNTKGSALTFTEGDANFTNLNTDKLEDITGEALNDLSNVNAAGPSNGHVLTYNTSTSQWVGSAPATSTTELSEDASPQLGGALDANGEIVSNSILKDYAETIHALGSSDSPTITISNGNVQSVTISSGLALPVFADAAAGQSVTLLVSGSGAATGTGNHIFAAGGKTLTTKSVVSIFYDGTTYWTSIATGFVA